MAQSFDQRAAERRKSTLANLARSKSEAAALSRARDAAILPCERAEAIWGLVMDLSALQGHDASELRLDRSLARVERRTRGVLIEGGDTSGRLKDGSVIAYLREKDAE